MRWPVPGWSAGVAVLWNPATSSMSSVTSEGCFGRVGSRRGSGF